MFESKFMPNEIVVSVVGAFASVVIAVISKWPEIRSRKKGQRHWDFVFGGVMAVTGAALALGAQSAYETLSSKIQSLPVGSIVAFGGQDSAIPSGWLLCDGSVKQRVNYPDLANILSGNWNNPAGSGTNSTFLVPDLQGMFLRGVDKSGTIDPDGVRRVGSAQQYATHMPQNPFVLVPGAGSHGHTGSLNHADDSARASGGLGFSLISTNGTITPTAHLIGGTDGQHTHALTGGDRETRPANIAVFWIIKAE